MIPADLIRLEGLDELQVAMLERIEATGLTNLRRPSQALEQLARKGLVALDRRGWRWTLTLHARHSLEAAQALTVA